MRYVIVALTVLVGACSPPVPDREVFTLYRRAVVGSPAERVHFATFDTANGRDYNWLGCTSTAESMNAREDTIVPYWCEIGRYRP